MRIAIVVVSIGLAVLFGVAGTANILYLPTARKETQHLQISSGLGRFIGLCQLAGAIGLIGGMWCPPLGGAAAAGVMLLMIGAVIVHRRIGDSAQAMLPAVAVFGIAAFVLGSQLNLLAG